MSQNKNGREIPLIFCKALVSHTILILFSGKTILKTENLKLTQTSRYRENILCSQIRVSIKGPFFAGGRILNKKAILKCDL